MLPRELRVSRCKAPHKTARAMEAKQKKFAGERGPKPDKKSKGSNYVPKITPDAKTLAGRAGKLLGRAAARAHLEGGKKKERRDSTAAPRRRESAGAAEAEGGKVMKSPEDIVFEGRRASAKDGKPKDLKFKGTRPKGDAKRKSIKSQNRGELASFVGILSNILLLRPEEEEEDGGVSGGCCLRRYVARASNSLPSHPERKKDKGGE